MLNPFFLMFNIAEFLQIIFDALQASLHAASRGAKISRAHLSC